MCLLDRLRKLKERNPDIADVIDQHFPEVVDDSPFIMVNGLFVRKNISGTTYLYQLLHRDRGLIVKCLSQDRYWSHHVKATNNDSCIVEKDLYLNEFDFKALLKKSGVSFDSIYLVTVEDICKVHSYLKNK